MITDCFFNHADRTYLCVLNDNSKILVGRVAVSCSTINCIRPWEKHSVFKSRVVLVSLYANSCRSNEHTRVMGGKFSTWWIMACGFHP